MPVTHTRPWNPPSTEPLWQALVHDTAAAVGVFDSEGVLLWCNALYVHMVGAERFEQVKGSSIENRIGHEMAVERLPILVDVYRSGKPVMIRDLRRGRALLLTMRRVEGQPAVILAVWRPADIPDWADAHVTDVPLAAIKHIDPGPLAALSEREKEILAFIGQGMTSAQIAKKLCRTIKTIEWHRSAIARKLKTKDRVALAKLAIQAGLCTPEFNQRLATMEAAEAAGTGAENNGD